MDGMRAIVNTPTGVEIADVPDPRPDAHEALVAVHAVSINRGELDLLKRRTQHWRPGQDVAGVVLRAAADGSGPSAGTRVVALVEQEGWAELVRVPVQRLAALPDAVEFDQAAALPLAGLTALRTLRLGGGLLGRRVLITGASGALGNLQAQLAIASGADVTAVVPPGRPTELASSGVTVVGDASAAEGQFELAADWVGGDSLAAVIGKIAPGGTVVLGSGNAERTPINVYDFIGHEGARIVAYLSYAHPEPPGPDLDRLGRLVAQGALRPPVGHVAPWGEVASVLGELAARRITGKAILRLR
jgi:NADPH:quinone reductase-like Zn-dependent oxidoreductase